MITEGNGLGGLKATFTASGTFYVKGFGVPSRVGQHDDGNSDPYNGNLCVPLSVLVDDWSLELIPVLGAGPAL